MVRLILPHADGMAPAISGDCAGREEGMAIRNMALISDCILIVFTIAQRIPYQP